MIHIFQTKNLVEHGLQGGKAAAEGTSYMLCSRMVFWTKMVVVKTVQKSVRSYTIGEDINGYKLLKYNLTINQNLKSVYPLIQAISFVRTEPYICKSV